MINSFSNIPNFYESISSHPSNIETRFRRGFDLFVFSSKEYLENASLSERKMYGILMEDYLEHEEIPDKTHFLSLFSPILSPIKPVEALTEALNHQETESSSLQENESESESNYLPGEDEGFLEEVEENLRKKSSDKSSLSSNTIQNKMKNHQGTFAGKVKKSCKQDRKTGRNTRLFEEATKDLTPERKEKFRKWALTYKKTFRTWNKLREFLGLNVEFGSLFTKMAILLLSNEFKNEYEECINKGQMSEKTKVFLRDQENKDFYIDKFSLIIETLQGKTNDFDSGIKKHRKAIKKD